MENEENGLQKTIDEIAEQTKNLSWDDLSDFLHIDEERAESVCQLSLVGRLVSRRTFSPQVIDPIIRSGRRFAREFQIDNIGQNRFLFTFTSLMDKDRILSQGPWNFRGALMVLKEWKSEATINDVDLSKALFWVRFMAFHAKVWRKRMHSGLVVKLGRCKLLIQQMCTDLFFVSRSR